MANRATVTLLGLYMLSFTFVITALTSGIHIRREHRDGAARQQGGASQGPGVTLMRSKLFGFRMSTCEEHPLLNLDEFTYERTNDLRDVFTTKGWCRQLYFWFMGRPSARKLGARCGWLDRIVENPGAHEAVVSSAHRQLARVYREMGYVRQSYAYTRERRWLQIRFGQMPRLQKLIDRLYSMCFGFGCSSLRTDKGWLNVASEGAKLILPLPHLGEKTYLALRTSAPWQLRLWAGTLLILSWTLFPLAIATFTGVLREEP